MEELDRPFIHADVEDPVAHIQAADINRAIRRGALAVVLLSIVASVVMYSLIHDEYVQRTALT